MRVELDSAEACSGNVDLCSSLSLGVRSPSGIGPVNCHRAEHSGSHDSLSTLKGEHS